MTNLEFYEKYWRIVNSDGSISAPTIRNIDREIFEIVDVSTELDVQPFIRYYGRLSKPRFIVNPIVQEELERRKLQ